MSAPTRILRRVTTVSLIWLLVASVFVAQNVVAAIGRGEPVQWLTAATFELEYWLVFLLATPFFVFMARRYRFEPGEHRASLAVHTIGGVAFALAQPVVALAFNYATLVALHATSAAEGLLPHLILAPLRLSGDCGSVEIRCHHPRV